MDEGNLADKMPRAHELFLHDCVATARVIAS